jgi:hypothetical protein
LEGREGKGGKGREGRGGEGRGGKGREGKVQQLQRSLDQDVCSHPQESHRLRKGTES